MKDGFVKVAAVAPRILVADVEHNVAACLGAISAAAAQGAKVITLPELCITGYTCEDLFWQDALLDAAEEGVAQLAQQTADFDAVVLAGVPVRVGSKLYNCAAVLNGGEILGIVPKLNIPTYNEFYEGRHFAEGDLDVTFIEFAGAEVPFGAAQLFACADMPRLILGVEICEDLWVPDPPSIDLAQAGATLICNLSASDEVVGKADYRRQLVSGQSARLVAGYMYASAGWGESTQDVVYGGHCMVAENGRMLAESKPFAGGADTKGEGPVAMAVSEVDFSHLASDRRRMSSYFCAATPEDAGYLVSEFVLEVGDTELTRFVDPHPFVPSNAAKRAERCEEIFAIQAHALARRVQHAHSKRLVVGVSGGLDSTLALLVCARALDLLGMERKSLLAITMPGFGTTERTHNNALDLSNALGAELREISIAAAVRQHFADIGHDEADHSVTYENAQARERTQILMDVANQEGGLVVGTGDLSELALGWATYNADHMSMYGVNCGVPKTLVRHLVSYVADEALKQNGAEGAKDGAALNKVLLDILDTPVSPELLPATGDGKISQKTEDLVGPYELHDFFLYNMLRCGFAPAKVYRLAKIAFTAKSEQHAAAAAEKHDDPSLNVGTYDEATILKWLKVFYKRFFQQQFKRSCLPDGPKVGSVAVSPRGDLRMPSDASATLWLSEIDALQ